MFKRIGLFFVVNILVVLSISLIASLLGVDRYIGRGGLDLQALAVMCLLWGMTGSLFSLAISRLAAKWLHGVRVIDPETAQGSDAQLVRVVHRLARDAGLPTMPEVGIYESAEVNAFATGPTRARALVAVSTGLLHAMDRNELEGVLGHEVAHIANGDMVTMTLLQGVVNAFVLFISRVIAFAVLRSDDGESGRGQAWKRYMLTMVLEMVLGLLGTMVVAWFSRRREYRADAGGARYAGRSRMVAALERLRTAHERQLDTGGAASLAALKISGGGVLALFSTHPPLEDRIARLRSSAEQNGAL